MKQQLKYVNFYNDALLRGCYTAFMPNDDGVLTLFERQGSYITPMFDTKEKGCGYNRLIIDGQFEGAKLEVIAAACDETDVFIDGESVSLNAYLSSPHVPPEKKAEVLSAMSCMRRVNTTDILLHSLKGRYVWIYAAVYPLGSAAFELKGMRLEVHKYSFVEYFPEIYHGNDFFERYIAVFQSMFMDAERSVDDFPILLDYHAAPGENVEYLAGWLGIDNSRGLFSHRQLRHLIENIGLFQGARGTKQALEQVIQMLTGVRPRIVEYFEWMREGLSASAIEANKALYGDTPSHFCVIMNLTKSQMGVSAADIEYLIESYCPLGAVFKVVYLQDCSHTDTHCYLDINSALSVPETAGLDSGAFGEHIVIG